MGEPINTPVSVILGQFGADHFNDTDAHEGKWAAIVALTSTVIQTLRYDDNTTTFSDLTLPAGLTIYGRFNLIQLSNGNVLAYKYE